MRSLKASREKSARFLRNETILSESDQCNKQVVHSKISLNFGEVLPEQAPAILTLPDAG
jgi:hypothetical protein